MFGRCLGVYTGGKTIERKPMKKQGIGIALALAAFAVLLTGCTKKVAEKTTESATERAIERATNSQVDVDLATNSVKINTNGGSYQFGGNVALPTGFPDDVYIIDGTLTSATTATENSGYTVSIETTKSVEEAKALYETQLKNEGWTIALSMQYESSAAVGGQKGNRNVSVSIAQDTPGKTLVVLSTSTTDQSY